MPAISIRTLGLLARPIEALVALFLFASVALADPAPLTLAVPYIPTPQPVVDKMLELARVGGKDFLIDLGSGDGRILITAAKRYGARGFGVDLNPTRIEEAQENARKAGVSDKVSFMRKDLFQTDLSQATVITLYLLPEVNLQLKPYLQALRPGTRIVSHDFHMGDWKPTRMVRMGDKVIYLWVVAKSRERAGAP